jgi:hypothetical protein
MFPFGQRAEDRDYRVTERAARIDVGFPEGSEGEAVATETVEIL